MRNSKAAFLDIVNFKNLIISFKDCEMFLKNSKIDFVELLLIQSDF